MDLETRGIIENAFDELMKTLDVRDITGWILDEYSAFITSREDLALGYVLGSFSRLAYATLSERKSWKKAEKEFEKKTGKKLFGTTTSEAPKTRFAVPSERDTSEIRDMLRRRIEDIMAEITRGLNV